MTNTTSEAFVVMEMDEAGKPTMRVWVLHSDVDANIFARMMNQDTKRSYSIRRANVTQFETK